MILPDRPPECTDVLVLYDLRDPDTWQRAHNEREAWGRELTKIHDLGPDHVAIEFLYAGALGASA